MFVFHFNFVKANNLGLWRLGMKKPRNSPQSCRYARLVAPIIERIDSGCASISMRVLIRLTAPLEHNINKYPVVANGPKLTLEVGAANSKTGPLVDANIYGMH